MQACSRGPESAQSDKTVQQDNGSNGYRHQHGGNGGNSRIPYLRQLVEDVDGEGHLARAGDQERDRGFIERHQEHENRSGE
jgi:hypothetical protein